MTAHRTYTGILHVDYEDELPHDLVFVSVVTNFINAMCERREMGDHAAHTILLMMLGSEATTASFKRAVQLYSLDTQLMEQPFISNSYEIWEEFVKKYHILIATGIDRDLLKVCDI
jgi:hypothetical protein